MQYLRFLEESDLVTITLVVPRYLNLDEELARRLERHLNGQGVIEEVLTRLDADFSRITSDLIVSCVEGAAEASAPVVVVSPFLTNEDVHAVLAGVRQERERNTRRRVRTTLGTLIDPQLYFHLPHASTKEPVLQLMADRMVELGYVEPSFLADVLDRERRSITSFGGEFAIPHSMHMDAHATAISVLVCDRGIPWGASRVKLVFLFALSPDGRQTFRDVLDGITRLLADRANTTALLEAPRTPDAFRATLFKLLDA